MKVSKTDIDSVALIKALQPHVDFIKNPKQTGWDLPDKPGLFLWIYGTRRYDKFGPIIRPDRHGFKAQLNSWCSKMRTRNVKCMPDSRETLLLKFLEVQGVDLPTYTRYQPEKPADAAATPSVLS